MALVTDIISGAGVNGHNVGQHLSLANAHDYYFMKGVKECMSGVKGILAVVDNPEVNSANIGEYLSMAGPSEYYVLKSLSELFVARGF